MSNTESDSDDPLELVPSKPSASSEAPSNVPPDGMAPPPPPPPPPGSKPLEPAEEPDPYKVETTADDRTFGLVAHISLLVCCLGPVGIYFTKGKTSKFIAFHSLQATCWMLLTTFCAFPMLFYTSYNLIDSGGNFIRSIPSMGFDVCVTLFFTVYSVYVGMGAYKGRLTEYLFIGPFVRNKIYGDSDPTTPIE